MRSTESYHARFAQSSAFGQVGGAIRIPTTSPMTVEKSLRLAKQLHAEGHVLAAAQAYQKILSGAPALSLNQTADLHHVLGFALYQLEKPEPARSLIEASLRASPINPEGWVHLAACMMGSSEPLAQSRAVVRAQILAPGHAEACVMNCRLATGKARLPIARRAKTAGTSRPDVWHELAMVRLESGFFVEAAEDLKRALCLAPGAGAAALNIADRWCDLARCQRLTRHPGRALRSGRRALHLAPIHTSALIEISAASFQLDRIGVSELAARKTAIHSPAQAEPYANLAECRYRRAAFYDALRLGRHAQILAPGTAQILTNLGSYHLALGNFTQGWALFRNRSGRRSLLSRFGSHPVWSGGPCSVLRVIAEQGLGDELMFSTCWPDLVGYRQRGEISRIEVEVDPRLIGLARRSFPDLAFFPRDIERPEDFPIDLSAAMPSLSPNGVVTLAGDMAAITRPSLDHFPTEIAPLMVDREKSECWRPWLDDTSSGKPRIGLCWRSALRSEDRTRYYPDIQDLRSILELNACFVILQYDECAAEVVQAHDLFGSTMVFPPDLDRKDDLERMAVLIEELDLVVSADTAVLALAARMNTPCVGLVSHATWVGLGTDRRPFFPSIEVMTRSTMSDGQPEAWTELSERAAERVASILSDHAV